jgi:hypothetical protein
MRSPVSAGSGARPNEPEASVATDAAGADDHRSDLSEANGLPRLTNSAGTAPARWPEDLSGVAGPPATSWPEGETHCECGVALADHPPLPKPGPLASWHAETATARMTRMGLFGGEEDQAPDIEPNAIQPQREYRRRRREAHADA